MPQLNQYSSKRQPAASFEYSGPTSPHSPWLRLLWWPEGSQCVRGRGPRQRSGSRWVSARCHRTSPAPPRAQHTAHLHLRRSRTRCPRWSQPPRSTRYPTPAAASHRRSTRRKLAAQNPSARFSQRLKSPPGPPMETGMINRTLWAPPSWHNNATGAPAEQDRADRTAL